MATDPFVVKDSGQRQEYASGMVRDVQDDKPMVRLIRSGPMFMRWAVHLTKGAVKYGRDNWTLANSDEELERFKDSAARHFEQWLNGEVDEDHAAAVFFNINAAEYVHDRILDDLWDDLLEVDRSGPPPMPNEWAADPLDGPAVTATKERLRREYAGLCCPDPGDCNCEPRS